MINDVKASKTVHHESECTFYFRMYSTHTSLSFRRRRLFLSCVLLRLLFTPERLHHSKSHGKTREHADPLANDKTYTLNDRVQDKQLPKTIKLTNPVTQQRLWRRENSIWDLLPFSWKLNSNMKYCSCCPKVWWRALFFSASSRRQKEAFLF